MDERLLEKIEDLNDIELTVLASLIAGQHCIFSTQAPHEFDWGDTLASICQSTFGIGSASLQCSEKTSIDELNESLLLSKTASYTGHNGLSTISFDPRRPSASRIASDDSLTEQKNIANAIIAIDLDLAPENVQVQLIELLRTKRIFTRNSMYTAPKDFLLIATLSQPAARLSYHLNDMFASSHLCTADEQINSLPPDMLSLMSRTEIDRLRLQATKVHLTAEVDAYLYNVVLCMRMSRYVQGGVSATATRQMRALCKSLAALHGIDFVTPSMVMLAARKIYSHRLVLATASTEKSLQWGSDPAAIKRLLESSTVVEVIDDVIASVETPL